MHRVFLLSSIAAAMGFGFLASRWSTVNSTEPEFPHRPVVHSFGSPARPETNRASTLVSGTPEWRAKQPVHALADEDQRLKALEAWAQADPAAAMAFARQSLKGDQLAQATTTILTTWARHDPDGAWNWVKQNAPDALYHFDTLLETFGRTSTDVAMKYARQYATEHPAAAVEVNLAALLGITYRGDFTGARALLVANADLPPEARGNLVNFIAGQWARFAPEEAAAWIQSLPTAAEREQAQIGLGESWSEADPAHAAAYAAELPAGNTRTVALRQAIGKWVMADPDAARAWVLDTNRHEDFDQAVGAIATDTNLVSRDPQRALRWAATIFDDQLRQQSVGAILFNWYPTDPAAATRYIESSADFSADQRASLLSRLQNSHGNG